MIPGIPALLDDLAARGVTVAIATGSSVRRLGITLDVAGLAGQFGDRIFSADQVRRGKPAPDLFLLAAERMGCPPAATLVIEDSGNRNITGFPYGPDHLIVKNAAKAKAASVIGKRIVLPPFSR